MTSVRDAFFNEIFHQIESGEDIYVVTADLGAPSLDDLRKLYPERYISVGIAEQSLISISAGIALSGHSVVAYGLLPFPVTRAIDQIRCVLSELNVNITVCGLNCGLCSAESGYTHLATDDFGMLRILPNIEIYTPSDLFIARELAKNTVKTKHPRFIRFDKAIHTEQYDTYPSEGFFRYGEENEGDILLVSSGEYIISLRRLVDGYRDKGIRIGLVDMFKYPVLESDFSDVIKGFRSVITIEENNVTGGIGSYVLEIMNASGLLKRVVRMGIDMSNGTYEVFTNREYIRKDQGLDIDAVTNMVEKELSIIG